MEKVWGRIPVLEALRAGKRRAHRLHVLRDAKGLEPLLRAAAAISVVECSRRDLDNMTKGAVHQGAVLEAEALPVCEAGPWIESCTAPDALVIVLDGVEDPHNFGAIARSAAACGAHGLMFAQDRSAPLSPVAVKSAAGAVEHIDLVCAKNLVRTMQQMKDAGFWLAALEADGHQTLWEADLTGRIALVIGSEGKGIRRLVRKHCDLQLRIPLQGAITSLNASVSAGVALAECLRQRASASR